MAKAQSDLSGETCVFCGIIKDNSRGQVVFKDDVAVAFLDANPLFLGHVLVVPREHYSTLSELPDGIIGKFFTDVKRISVAVGKSMMSDGTFVAMNNKVSQSVPHLHVHVVPRRFGDGLKGFFWPRVKYKDAKHIKETQDSIIKGLKGL